MTTIDYPRVWKTLLKMGFRSVFSDVRLDFFMNIANSGPRTYTGEEALNHIIANSRVVAVNPGMKDYIKKAILPNEKFKHYYYESTSQQMMIEYFAIISNSIPKEYLEFVGTPSSEQVIDGNCLSMVLPVDIKHIKCDDTDVSTDESIKENLPNYSIHLIVIGENNGAIDANNYPSIIKHELTHACIYNMRKRIKDGFYKSHLIPSDWTDQQYEEWQSEIAYVEDVLNQDTEDAMVFKEFICEFMMFESDGMQKVKNPVPEVKHTKTGKTKMDNKPKITYRTVTPFDRFQETIDTYEESYGELYTPILETLRPFYENYDEFLDEIRM